MFRTLTYLSLFALVGANLVAAGEQETSASYRFSLASLIQMDFRDKVEKLSTLTTLDYTWKRKGSESTLLFDSADVKASKDGLEVMNLFLSRDKMKSAPPGQVNEKAFKDAPEEFKPIMKDGFGCPLCKIATDAEGRIGKKVVLAGSGAKDFVESGLLANALLFHPPFAKLTDKWQAPAEITLGNGGYARGNLTYEKLKTDSGQTRVKVSGRLTNDSYKVPGAPLEIKNVRYEVTGEQLYDNQKSEWSSGEMSFDIAYTMEVREKEVGTVKGVMKVKLAAR